MKREALLDCFDTMKACYGHAWARTSVDLAVEVWPHVAHSKLLPRMKLACHVYIHSAESLKAQSN